MEIRFVRADPTGNITALVESFPHSLDRAAAAERVFAADGSIEQLGFLGESSEADIALSMAGGEFCGNACLCAAAYRLSRTASLGGSVSVAISGAERPVVVDMVKDGEGYSGTVDMPLPVSFEEVSTSFGNAPMLRFSGICHIIAPASLGKETAEDLIVPLCRSLGAEALGLMLFDEAAGSMAPLVYVPDAGTLCWEHSCASGTSAVGAYLALSRGKSQKLNLRQSGGVLSISAELVDGRINRLRLGGKVRLGAVESVEI